MISLRYRDLYGRCAKKTLVRGCYEAAVITEKSKDDIYKL